MASKPTDLQAAWDAAAEGEQVQVLDGLPLLEEATGHKQQGNECVKKKQYNDAVRHYEEGLQTLARSDGNPLIPEERQQVQALKATLHSNIAQCMLNLELYRRAIDAASECIELDEANAKAYHRRSQAYEALKEYEEALQDALKLKSLGGGGMEASALEARCESLFERQAKRNVVINKVAGEHELMMKMKERFEVAWRKHKLDEADAAPEIARWLVAHDDLSFTVDKVAEKWKMSKKEAEDVAKWISKGLELGIVPQPDVVK
jgi:tetratricopeptide (TPR) repeat protein